MKIKPESEISHHNTLTSVLSDLFHTRYLHFSELINQRQVRNNELMVSFDVSSLFTNVPVEEALDIVKDRLETDHSIHDRTNLSITSLIDLLNMCLKSTYFLYNNKFYQQSQGAAMGSPLSPIIANIFMEFLEDIALQTANIKPSLWLRYVDDTFTLWPHNRQSLNMFLEHLTSLRPSIKFTMEVESNHQLPFLDVMVERTNSNSIITKVYRKPTHTDRYLNYRSYHSHSVKNGIIHTLKHRAKTICRDEITLTEEMEHLKSVFKKNGYPCDIVNRALHHQRNKRRSKEEQSQRTEVTTTIPYVKGVSEGFVRNITSR